MSKEMWSAVSEYRNGDSLNAEVLNVPIGQLGARTSYLYERLKDLINSGTMSSVILTDVELSTETGLEPSEGNVVYLDNESVTFAKAKAAMSLYDDFTAAESAFSVGILQRKDGNMGDVLVYGKMDLAGGSPIQTSQLIESGETFRPGRYYLSSNEAGRLSANPNGPLIYVCSIVGTVYPGGSFESGTAIVNPQYLDIGTSHVHRTAALTARPAGTFSVDGYLPVAYASSGSGDSSDSGDAVSPSDSPLALRFGGTWTAKEEITYKFWFTEEQDNWKGGVKLYWNEWYVSENRSKEGFVYITAPDVSVPVSNGLTVSVSFPNATPTMAYEGLDVDQRTWAPLVFPEAGKGWLAHSSMAVADLQGSSSISGTDGEWRADYLAAGVTVVSGPEYVGDSRWNTKFIINGVETTQTAFSSDGEDATELKYAGGAIAKFSRVFYAIPHIAIKGKIDASPTYVKVAFPSSVQILTIGAIEAGDTFAYNGVTYEFTSDADATEENAVFVGPTLADSTLHLARKMNKVGAGTFAVAESNNAIQMVAMNAGETFSVGGIVSDVSGKSIEDYNVIGASDISMVVFDGESRILGEDAVVSGIESYTWNDIGNGLSVLVFQDVSGGSAVIHADDIFECVMEDDEPNALYDYCIGFEPKIANYWPPVPARAAALIVNGVEMDNKALLPENPTVSFGRKTVHWFENAEGKKPWPETLERRDAPVLPAMDKTEVMHWVRGFQGSTGPVTSLQVRDGSPFRVVGYGTEDVANVGDLEIVGDFDFEMVNGGAPGFIVPKRARSGKLVGGPVVERILGGPGVSVVSQAGCPDGQGTVVLSLDNGSYQNQFSDIALENAEQAKIGMFPYIRLKGYATAITSPSAFTAVMRVPMNLPDGQYALRLQASVFGESSFTAAARKYACVKFLYNILPDYMVGSGLEYKDLKTGLLEPDNERTVLIPFGHEDSNGIVYNGFDPIVIRTGSGEEVPDVSCNALGYDIPAQSDFRSRLVELRPGNLVGVRLSRAVTPGDRDAYTGPLGFINLSWSLVSNATY